MALASEHRRENGAKKWDWQEERPAMPFGVSPALHVREQVLQRNRARAWGNQS